MLPAIPTPREKVRVGGVDVEVRGLTVGECQELAKLGETLDAEVTGVQALAWGCDVTLEEADAWIKATSPQFGAQVAEHIMRLSGMTDEAGARFPAPVHGGDRRNKPVRVVRPAKKNTAGDKGHAP